MASGEEPGINFDLSPSDGEQEESNVRDPGIFSVDESRLACPNPDLGPNSPSPVRERSFIFGTPSGEVRFRRSDHYEHEREPAQELMYIMVKTKVFRVEIKKQMILRRRLPQCRHIYL